MSLCSLIKQTWNDAVSSLKPFSHLKIPLNELITPSWVEFDAHRMICASVPCGQAMYTVFVFNRADGLLHTYTLFGGF
jgi:hypothetical protein